VSTRLSASLVKTFNSTYIVSFDNGKMLLICLTPQKDNNGLYQIQDVKIVPDEFKKYFK
jgi:S-adenosylmethionine hydrolase